MAKKGNFLNKVAHEPIHHKTSIGRRPSSQKMNKNTVDARLSCIKAKGVSVLEHYCLLFLC